MQWYIFGVLAFSLSFINAQQLVGIERDNGPYSPYSVGVGSASSGDAAIGSSWTEQNRNAQRNAGVELEISNIFSGGVQVFKQVPYLELLKLVESFLKLKGEVAGRLWGLFADNEHIFNAIKQTFIANIGTVHNLTLTFIVILRKVLEFAANLFGNTNFGVNFG